MYKVIVGLAITAMLAACSSSPTNEQKGAAIEDRTATTATPKPPTGPSTGGVTDGKIPTVEVKPPPSTPGDMAGELGKRSIYFDFDSNIVKEEFLPTVAAHARNLTQNRDKKMIIQGNTDERGSREYNLALGQRRADAVKQMMTVLGAQGAQIETVSFGEEKPRAQGGSESAMSENRRADIVYQGE